MRSRAGHPDRFEAKPEGELDRKFRTGLEKFFDNRFSKELEKNW